MLTGYFKKTGAKRLAVMVVGNIFLGMGISIFKFSGLGNDPFSGMVMALSECVKMEYAVFLILLNVFIVLVWQGVYRGGDFGKRFPVRIYRDIFL